MLQSPIPSAFSRKWRIKKHASEKPTCLIIFPRNGSIYSSLDLPSLVHDHAFVFTVIFENMIKSLP